jgi:hypothetical protein
LGQVHLSDGLRDERARLEYRVFLEELNDDLKSY